MAADDFILTLDSDSDSPAGPSTPVTQRSKTKTKKAAPPPATPGDDDDVALNDEFEFDASGFGGSGGAFSGLQDGVDWRTEVRGGGIGADGKAMPITVDDIITRRTGRPIIPHKERKAAKAKRSESDEESEEEDEDEEDADEEDEEDGDVAMESDGEEDGFGRGVASDLEESDVEDGEGEDEDEDEDMGDGDEDEDEEEEEEVEEDSDDDSGSGSESEEETAASLARKAAFFDDAGTKTDPTDPLLPTTFASMSLSRPLLRALTSLGLATPTPIQAKAIPLALLGRDVLGSAVTGSGKTAAFMVPILERLCYRDRSRGGAACRVLVLCPTRELAVQCEAVGKSLVEKAGMDVRFALLVGGLSLSAQAHTLRTLPDILIATPGRLIDHINNSQSFTLSALDILVIDEADRMLEVGFEAELNEIISACPRKRQTMLFSATMTDSVDELVKLSLDKPVRVFVDPKRSTAKNLVQEFVRVRDRVVGGEKTKDGVKGEDRVRAASLLALCKKTVREKAIVFFRSKALAHQMRIVFGLCGLKAAEIHGNLTQEQRLQALQDFKDGQVDYLLATDVASRGLDIKGVETVINYDMPSQLSAYTHRVGRTARAGRKGRSITLVGEQDRKMLKAAIKQSKEDMVKHRVIPVEAVVKCAEQLEGLRSEVGEVLKEEKEEKMLRQADMEVRKGQNMIEHEAEIYSRPARTWFQSEKEKLKSKEAGKAAYVGSFPAEKGQAEEKDKVKRGKYEGLSRKQTRRKLAREQDDADPVIRGSSGASIRAAKKAQRPGKITEPLKADARGKAKAAVKQAKKKAAKAKGKVGKGGFERDAGARGAGGKGEGMRAGRGDGVGMGGKSKSKGKVGGKGKAPAKKRR